MGDDVIKSEIWCMCVYLSLCEFVCVWGGGGVCLVLAGTWLAAVPTKTAVCVSTSSVWLKVTLYSEIHLHKYCMEVKFWDTCTWVFPFSAMLTLRFNTFGGIYSFSYFSYFIDYSYRARAQIFQNKSITNLDSFKQSGRHVTHTWAPSYMWM